MMRYISKFWPWVQSRLAITTTNERLSAVESEVARLRKKVIRKPKTYEQIERRRSCARHPGRHGQ